MYGVCKSWTDYGGGGGYYEGGVSRSIRYWWDGKRWSDKPVNVGPFQTREAAQAFAAKERKDSDKWCYDYGENDPFGTDTYYYMRPDPVEND